MVDIIAPRRGEILTDGGKGTTRFMEYLERTTQTVNEQGEIDDTENTIAASPAALSAVMKELDSVQIELATVGATSTMLARVIKRLSDLEAEAETVGANGAMLARVFKRLADLETASIGTESAAIAALQSSTFDRRYALLVG